MEKIKVILVKLIAYLVAVPFAVAVFSLLALFAGALMQMFGFTYQSVGSVVVFFLIFGILAFPTEWLVKAVSKVLFSHFKKIKEFEAWIMLVVLNTALSMVRLSLVDYFMESVSATPLSLFVISLVMSLSYSSDEIEKMGR